MADNVYNLKFTLSNGDVIDAGQITAPQGPKGDKGDSATIDADTLNGLLSGSNGIAIAKNAAGDKVDIKLSNSGFTIGDTAGTVNDQTITINPHGEDQGAYISVNYHGSVGTKITPFDITFTDMDGSVSQGLTSRNVKTIFGQSIYGIGKITLYRHNIHIAGETTDNEVWCNMIIISSNNMVVDSLTDLYTLCNGMGDLLPISGLCKLSSVEGKGVAILCRATASGGIYWIGSDNASRLYTWSSMPTLTITDTVTTV